MTPTLRQRIATAVRAIFGLGISGGAGTPVFAGGQLSRLTSDWVTTPLSPDRELAGDLSRLRARARALVRDTPYGAQFLRLLADNVIGPAGIALQGRVKTARGEFNRAVNDEIERGWREWSRPRYASADGRLSWAEIQRLAVQTLAQDGECYIRKIRDADSPFGFALQFLDADQLDETVMRKASDGVPEIRMGIEVNQWGRPQAYYFWRRHPDGGFGAGGNDRVRIPAEEIIALAVPTRVGQIRGYSWFAPVILQLRMLEGYQEAEVTAARVAAAKMGAITVDPEAYAGDLGTPPDHEPLQMPAEPGSWQELPPGHTLTMFDPQHPTTAYRDFVKGVLHGIAAGMGASYASLSSDLEGTSYASGRTGLLQERDHWRAIQRYVVDHLCWPVYAEWLEQTLLAGGLKLDGRVKPEQYQEIEWQPRGWAWVDPKNDVEAAVLAIQHGMDSRTHVMGESGRDVEETFAALDRESQLAKEYGVEITAPKPAAPAAAPAAAPDEDRVAAALEGLAGELRRVATPAPAVAPVLQIEERQVLVRPRIKRRHVIHRPGWPEPLVVESTDDAVEVEAA